MSAATIPPEDRSPQLKRYYRVKHTETYKKAANKAKRKYNASVKGRRCYALAARQQTLELRRKALELLGGRCTQCPWTDPRALQIDHIDGGGHQERKKLGNRGILKNVLKHPENYQLLCANHNWIKKVERHEATALKHI